MNSNGSSSAVDSAMPAAFALPGGVARQQEGGVKNAEVLMFQTGNRLIGCMMRLRRDQQKFPGMNLIGLPVHFDLAVPEKTEEHDIFVVEKMQNPVSFRLRRTVVELQFLRQQRWFQRDSRRGLDIFRQAPGKF